MRLEEAIETSPVKTAYRPYYSSEAAMENPYIAKYIVIRDFNDIYLVYADTFRYVRPLPFEEMWKTYSRTDWLPVGSRVGNTFGNTY